MIRNNDIDLRQINLYEIKPSGFVNESALSNTLEKLDRIKSIVGELLTIQERVELPGEIAGKINQYKTEVLAFIYQIEKTEEGSSDVIARKKDMVLKSINSYYAKCFSLRGQDSKGILEYYALAKSFDRITEEDLIKGFNSLKQGLDVKVAQAGSLIQELNQKSLEVDTIVKELKKKSSQQTVSDYAVVFGEEAVKYKRFARNWLWAGIAISILFIAFMFWSTTTNILRTEIINEETGHFIRYNFTNLASKVIIIAVIVFIMSFAFKQYSINRHLQTLSQHRQNALNSYKLLTASISGDDTSSRNTLMIQIAKAIYEHSQSTGFLNDKGQNVNSGIVELTKIIGKNGS